MATTIMIVDDDAKITALLRRSLTYEGYRVVEAGEGHQALELAEETEPELVILDVMLPGISGIEVCRRLRERGDRVPVLMLTARDEITDRVQGLDSGADDYLVKPFALEELLARVRALLRRTQPGGDQQLRFADLELDTSLREARRGDRQIPLTTKEYELLHYFLRQPRRVISREELMDRIWGYDFAGESNVLEVYIGYLRNKLEADGEKRLIHTVRGAGYVMRE
ncbi:MAG: response regulator transcription factor [Clostridia bacterium]|nr:MAG: response regulator transcription factor [Clostridia bacterium]